MPNNLPRASCPSLCNAGTLLRYNSARGPAAPAPRLRTPAAASAHTMQNSSGELQRRACSAVAAAVCHDRCCALPPWLVEYPPVPQQPLPGRNPPSEASAQKAGTSSSLSTHQKNSRATHHRLPTCYRVDDTTNLQLQWQISTNPRYDHTTPRVRY